MCFFFIYSCSFQDYKHMNNSKNNDNVQNDDTDVSENGIIQESEAEYNVCEFVEITSENWDEYFEEVVYYSYFYAQTSFKKLG